MSNGPFNVRSLFHTLVGGWQVCYCYNKMDLIQQQNIYIQNYSFHRLRDQIATCPNCRVEISKSTASRNLAVEKAVSELPSECEVSEL